MTKKTTQHGSKNLAIAIILIVGAAAAYGYFNQSSELREPEPAVASTAEAGQPAAKPLPPADHVVFTARPGEIVIGQTSAPITIIEYASLSCPHCAHFHEVELPKLKKAYIDTGKAKLVFRHFPLNEPAMRGAQMVECLGGDQRADFLKTLFLNQKKWAYEEKYVLSLKPFAAAAGIDAARFDSCLADKPMENRILGVRMEAAQVMGVEHTPSIFVYGKKLEGESTFAAIRKAIEAK